MKKIPWGGIAFFAFLVLLALAIFLKPDKSEVDSFMEENACGSFQAEDYDDEYWCANYLRRHTTSIFGKIYSGSWVYVSFAFLNNPFHYFNYPTVDEELLDRDKAGNNATMHVYLLVDTSDSGKIVYNPVNGEYLGTLSELAHLVDGFIVLNPEGNYEYMG